MNSLFLSPLEPKGECVVQTEIGQSQFRTKTGYHSHTMSQDIRADNTAIQCNKQHQTHQELKRAAKMQKYQWILDLVVFLLSDAITVGTKLFLSRLALSVGKTNQQPGAGISFVEGVNGPGGQSWPYAAARWSAVLTG